MKHGKLTRQLGSEKSSRRHAAGAMVSIGFCVGNVVIASLTYKAEDNVETCDNN